MFFVCIVQAHYIPNLEVANATLPLVSHSAIHQCTFYKMFFWWMCKVRSVGVIGG
jgi:hypothetical protein